jgi:hypothetical protein
MNPTLPLQTLSRACLAIAGFCFLAALAFGQGSDGAVAGSKEGMAQAIAKPKAADNIKIVTPIYELGVRGGW